MIYTKVEISPGVILNVDVDTDELYSVCPSCGIEHQVEFDLAVQLEDWTSSITCGKEECNEKLRNRVDVS